MRIKVIGGSLPRAERKTALLLIELIRDMEWIKREFPSAAEKTDQLEFDIELALMKFAHGRDLNIEELDAKWNRMLLDIFNDIDINAV